jgi:2-oxoglutarate dehydrogenase E2 component (dihydrolipoamide succinyltransferase)
MKIDITIPSVGESVQEAILAEWFKKDGETVKKGEPLFVIETDKVTLEIEAEADGVLSISVQKGETVAIGAVVGSIDTQEKPTEARPKAAPQPEPPKAPATGKVEEKQPPAKNDQASREMAAELKPAVPEEKTSREMQPKAAEPSAPQAPMSPAVRRIAAQKDLDISRIDGTGPGGRVTKSDVLLFLESTPQPGGVQQSADTTPVSAVEDEPVRREKMSPIRQRIARHLLSARQNTAMLTTFNDVDMSRVMELRKIHRDDFKKKHGVSLGFMSFFIKASVAALKDFPRINAFIEDQDIVYHDYHHIGVAIGAERGLVVPVIRHADRLSFAELEQAIVDFVERIKTNQLKMADLEGGTFTITNGGVFGSLLSTPILNAPQSGILGMHRIDSRPVAIDDQVVIRPMMYIALSYDHRIVDGREAVTFLRRIKECIEHPELIMLEI